ncbi:MAG: CdaR family protein [Spirochaetia bacterium]|nr:CdaR family protein [Spirochaetia bacterium]
MKWILQKIIVDWKAKAVSLVLACLFWVYVQELQYDTISLSIPIDYINKPRDIYWKTEPPRFVKLGVRGKKDEIKFPTSTLKAVVDLSESKPGKHLFHIQFDKNQIPEKISLASFSDSVFIEFDNGIQKQLWVKPVIQGEVSAGYKQGRVTINPNKILVEGPAETLNKIRYIETKPIIINDLKETFTYHSQINSNNQFKLINGSEIEVTVTVYKQDTTNEKLVENIKIDILGKDPALVAALSTNTAKIYVRGDADDLKKLDPNQFHAFISLDGTRFIAKTLNILPFDYEPDITINIKNLYTDKKIEILELIPSTVSVRFSVKPEFLKKAEEALIKDEKPGGENPAEEVLTPKTPPAPAGE